ncbi:hypothetical protein M1116_03870 [Patescibacteria group bacterium]|nr:hypothetical protein [Patescibacteria group bacterium]
MKNNPVPSETDTTPPKDYPQTFDELYKLCTNVLINGNEEQVAKMWKTINRTDGIWNWIRVKIITDCYEQADAKGKEEFSLIAMEKHLKSGNAVQLKEEFVDSETGIRYRQYKFRGGRPYRIPIATEGMDKHAYHTAMNKKFIGDCIEQVSGGEDKVTIIPLDNEEKVKAYNDGIFYEKYFWNKEGKTAPKRRAIKRKS